MKKIERANVEKIKKNIGADLNEYIAMVIPIIESVKKDGDRAIYRYAELFKDPIPESLKIENKKNVSIPKEVKKALYKASENIRKYHERQLPKEWSFSVSPGICSGEIVRPLERVGCYVPGGKYPLVSSVLMTAIPAKVAGVEEIIVCTPKPTPEILFACELAGVQSIFQAGGAQAIAAMAYGTESIPKVQKIVGPGNHFVSAAKKLVYGDVDIDFIAGPSEVVIIGDENANPEYIAADMLAQAEHDENARSIFLTPSNSLARQVREKIIKQLKTLPTADIAKKSLDKNGNIFIVKDLKEAFEISNYLAPEHLELHLNDISWLEKVKNAGAVFLGEYSVEAAGDYASGPSHVLPTNGMATRSSGLSVRDFIKMPSFQKLNKEGLKSIGETIKILARIEGLEGHARSVEIRGI